tara:strand:+ start:18208 stop:19044 length:837 start_codon:yes stop_codon:yes gene_type:complete
MHKKLAADLTSLAHSILQMKNKEDVFALKTKAYEVYEKLAVLAYVEEYINNTPNAQHTKEELTELLKNTSEKLEKELEVKKDIIAHDSLETVKGEVVLSIENEDALVKHQLEDSEEEVLIKNNEDLIEGEIELIADDSLTDIDAAVEKDDLFSHSEPILDVLDEVNTTDMPPSLEEELKDTIAADVVADLFENAPKKSLNDKLQGDIQIGLNDRITFVKNLFGGSQEDFNRVVSQLNSFKTKKEAKKFINKMVKPDYDWTDKEDIEGRFIAIVERKFL